MTVSSIVPVNNYQGNDSTTIFDFDFLIENEYELVVTHISENEVSSELKYGIDYSIHEIGNKKGSYILFPLAGSDYGVLKSNEAISLALNLEIKQESKFENSSFLNLSVLEWTFDYIIRILQMLNRKVERCFKAREGTSDLPDNMYELIISFKREAEKNAEKALKFAEEAKKFAQEAYQALIGNLCWGKIFGNISDQKDLKNALDNKLELDASNITASNAEKIGQIRSFPSENILDEKEVFLNIRKLAHSTFDVSKFSIVKNSKISDDGLASFVQSSYIDTGRNIVPGNSAWNISLRVIVNEDFLKNESYIISTSEESRRFDIQHTPANNTICLTLYYNNGSKNSYIMPIIYNSKLNSGDIIDIKFGYNSTNKEYFFNIVINNDIEQEVIQKSSNALWTQESTKIILGNKNSSNTAQNYMKGIIDLKYFSIYANGTYEFIANKTNSDNVKIGTLDVSIPYVLSKTGSKIVIDTSYRDKVQNLYKQNGYALYFTLDELNKNYTLPLGEIYGMLQKSSSSNPSLLVGLPVNLSWDTVHILNFDCYVRVGAYSSTMSDDAYLRQTDSAGNLGNVLWQHDYGYNSTLIFMPKGTYFKAYGGYGYQLLDYFRL